MALRDGDSIEARLCSLGDACPNHEEGTTHAHMFRNTHTDGSVDTEPVGRVVTLTPRDGGQKHQIFI